MNRTTLPQDPNEYTEAQIYEWYMRQVVITAFSTLNGWNCVDNDGDILARFMFLTSQSAPLNESEVTWPSIYAINLANGRALELLSSEVVKDENWGCTCGECGHFYVEYDHKFAASNTVVRMLTSVNESAKVLMTEYKNKHGYKTLVEHHQEVLKSYNTLKGVILKPRSPTLLN